MGFVGWVTRVPARLAFCLWSRQLVTVPPPPSVGPRSGPAAWTCSPGAQALRTNFLFPQVPSGFQTWVENPAGPAACPRVQAGLWDLPPATRKQASTVSLGACGTPGEQGLVLRRG